MAFPLQSLGFLPRRVRDATPESLGFLSRSSPPVCRSALRSISAEPGMPINKSAGVSSDHRRPSSSKDSDSSEAASNTLWVGELSAETTDSDLMVVFSKHGALDCTTMQSARNYTFVYFRQVEEAKFAKEALQGSLIHGRAIRIEFARPVLYPMEALHNAPLSSSKAGLLEAQVETSKIFLRDTSVISPYSLLLFGGSVVIQYQSAIFATNEVVKSIVQLLLEED